MHYEQFADGSVKCIESEIPFELPEGWAWCRGISIFDGMDSKRPAGESFRYIDIDAIDNKNHIVISPKSISTSNAPSRASRGLRDGSVLFSLVRPYLENIALIIERSLCDCIASTGFYICNSNGALFTKYMFYLMLSNYVIKGLSEYMKGDNSSSIRKDQVENFLYPVPPIKEQEIIAHQIELTLKYVNEITLNKGKLANIHLSLSKTELLIQFDYLPVNVLVII